MRMKGWGWKVSVETFQCQWFNCPELFPFHLHQEKLLYILSKGQKEEKKKKVHSMIMVRTLKD